MSKLKILFFSIIIGLTAAAVITMAWTNPTGNPPTGSGSGAFVPAGAVMYFNLPSCPVGWSSMAAAQGRYIVGGALDLNGIGTALSNQENRAVGQHNHGVNDPSHGHGVSDPGHSHTYFHPVSGNYAFNDGTSAWVHPWTEVNWNTGSSYTGISIQGNNTGISIQNAGLIAGTNAPYIQLLVCSKN